VLDPAWTRSGSGAIHAVLIDEKYNKADIPPESPYAVGDAPVGVPGFNSSVYLYLHNILKLQGLATSDIIEDVLAHELGHTVNLKHCPVDNSQRCYLWARYNVAAPVNHYMDHHNRDYDVNPKAPNFTPQPGIDDQNSAPRAPRAPSTAQSSSSSSGSDSGGADCPSHETPPTGPTTRSSESAPVWRSAFYLSGWDYERGRDYVTNSLVEYPLNLSYLTGYAVPTHANRYHNHDGFLCGDPDANGFSVVSISPSHETSTGDYIVSPGIVEVDGEMKLRLSVNYYRCGVWTFVIRARNDSGYADVTYVLELYSPGRQIAPRRSPWHE